MNSEHDLAPDAPIDAPGRLLAVSISPPRSVEWRGETIRTGIFKSPVAQPLIARRQGIEGDGQADAWRNPLLNRLGKRRPTLRP